ncbi:MAG: mechanosensitive ion channel, partial [Gammaproteobacteria bacterium]
MLGVLGVLAFWWKLGALREALHATSEHVGKPSQDRFTYTLRAVFITLLITLPWPLLAFVTGYELTNSWEATASSRAVGRALLRTAPLLFFLRFFRVLCMPGGVAEGHFRWSPEGLSRLRRQMDLLMFTLFLPAFVLIVSARFAEPKDAGALNQILFLVLVIGLMYFLYRLLTPRGGIVQALRRRGATEDVLPWPWFWLALSMLIPAGLGVMAWLGFMYSAGSLLGKLINSMWLVFGLVFLRELIIRWLLVLRRRLLLREALERREAARAAKESGAGEDSPVEEIAAVAAEPVGDIVSLDADTRKLLNVSLVVIALLGLSGIWSDVLPAIGLFSDVTLWQSVQNVGGEQQVTAVTLADLLIAVLVIALTVVAARNLPSLLDILLRQRPGITPGSRLAFATLARYTIATIGLAYVLATIGLDWSKLQWLVAALGVGIGFGLQEIVANFISGLIILVERPVRVGDVVTVGDTSGVVTRVQIRATTIRTWDRQELLVPNKEFITGRVLNWSLSDDILRIHFVVGVAYGSDVERALALMEEAA